MNCITPRLRLEQRSLVLCAGCRRGGLRAVRVARRGGLDWNTPAIKFYESLRAKTMKEWLTMRLVGDAPREVAARAKA